jgi:hypothetical protein
MTRILRGLTGRRLDCGCVLGVYETYDGRVVTVLDERSGGCHRPHDNEATPADSNRGSSSMSASA